MVMFEKFRPVIWWIVALAALNWAFVGFFDFNVVTDVITLSANQVTGVYGVIGGTALINMYNLAHEM